MDESGTSSVQASPWSACVKRYLLARGDRAGAAQIVEGLPHSAYVGLDGARVSLATVYMKTWCEACRQEGYISPRGPRHFASAENRRQFALSGDVNACRCEPQPVFEAVRSIFQTVTASRLLKYRRGSRWRRIGMMGVRRIAARAARPRKIRGAASARFRANPSGAGAAGDLRRCPSRPGVQPGLGLGALQLIAQRLCAAPSGPSTAC